MKMTVVAIAMATTERMPTLSSVHPSERVRGMEARAFLQYIDGNTGSRAGRPYLRQESLQIGIGGALQLARRSLEDDVAVLQHDELRLFRLLLIGRFDVHPAVRAQRPVPGHEKGVAQLVGDDDGADALDVPKLHDLLVDRGGGNRVEPRRRLVVEQDAGLGRHR